VKSGPRIQQQLMAVALCCLVSSSGFTQTSSQQQPASTQQSTPAAPYAPSAAVQTQPPTIAQQAQQAQQVGPVGAQAPSHIELPHSRNPFAPYRPSTVPPINLTNSPRLQNLERDGKLYVSLRDAISLALENNLDIAYFRYNLPIAQADLLRTKAGALANGVNTNVSLGTQGGFSSSGGGGGGGGVIAGGAGGLVQSTLGGGAPIPSFDPQLDQELLTAQLQLKSDQVAYHNLQTTLQSALMDKKATAATVNSDYSQAQLQAQTDKQLFNLGVISGLAYNKSKSSADELTTRNSISVEQVDMNAKAIQTQLDVQQAKIDQDKAMLKLKEDQKAALEVKAGIDGVLTALGQQTSATATSDQSSLGVGAHVQPGATLATVVVPNQLKAQLKIAETQAHDILLGQPAEIDTHNGIVPGHVTRIDPAVVNGTITVDVKPDAAWPPGAVPQLSVDGTVDLERLKDVLNVGRPAFGNPNSTISLFKYDPDGKTATRTQVKVGKASVTQIQILSGLNEGDKVILSDMSRNDNVDKVRLE